MLGRRRKKKGGVILIHKNYSSTKTELKLLQLTWVLKPTQNKKKLNHKKTVMTFLVLTNILEISMTWILSLTVLQNSFPMLFLFAINVILLLWQAIRKFLQKKNFSHLNIKNVTNQTNKINSINSLNVNCVNFAKKQSCSFEQFPEYTN